MKITKLLTFGLLSICLCSLESLAGMSINHNSQKEDWRSLLTEGVVKEELNGEKAGVELVVRLSCDYEDMERDSEVTTSIFDIQKKVKEVRAANKKTTAKLKEQLSSSLKIFENGFEMSRYAPFAFKMYDDIDEYRKDEQYLDSLAASGSIEKAYVSSISPLDDYNECTVLTSSSSATLTLAQAKSMIGVSSTSYTGDGVKIGILDEAYPSVTTNFPSGCIAGSNVHLATSEHTARVASIIGGTYGIAPDADLYIASCNPLLSNYATYSLVDSTEWLLDQDVNVINMSLYNHNEGFYDGQCAYVDYVIRHNWVSFVKSAGNSSQTKLITNPGMALNAFTVGSVDGNKYVSYFSSYDVDDDYEDVVLKPTLVAPGENITIPNINNSDSGTSFSAPMVTGCLALLMDQFPLLMEYPELALSAVVNGAVELPSQNTHWDNNCGAGLLNYQSTVSVLSNYYVIAFASNGSPDGYLAGNGSFIIPANAYGYFVFYNMINGANEPSLTVSNLSYSKYSIVIKDSFDNVLAESNSDSNMSMLSVPNTTSTSKTVTAYVYLRGSKVGTELEYSALSFEIHSHSYNHHYHQYTTAKHKAYCSCGLYVLESHVANPNSTFVKNGHTYSNCLKCGALMNLDGPGIINGNTKKT